MNINLYINKQSARAEAPEIFSGSVGVLTVTLFGELDSSLTPVLRFMHESGEGYYTAKIENGCATVPHEVIHAPGFSIAVAGYENDGEEVIRFIPTEAVYISVKENGYGSPDDAVSEEEASQSLIGQILSECQSVRGEVTDAKNAMSQELSDAKDEMTDSILYAKEELNRKYSSIKNELEDMADVVLSEEEAREKADNALEAAVGKERSDRETADGELLTALDTEAKARADADSALEAAVAKEKTDREAADGELRAELSKKVSKEDGKGLSDISGIDHMGHAAVDGTIGGNFANAREFYHEFVITHQSGTEDSISVYDIEQTCAVIDEKLSSFKPSDDVDLSEYVKKEAGFGLSAIRDITVNISTDEDIISSVEINRPDRDFGIPQTIAFYSAAQIDKKLSELPSGGGDVDLSGYYTADEVDSLLNEKEFIKSKKTISVLTDNTIELTKNRDYILDEIESLLFTCDPMEVVAGRANEVYVFFKSGETPTTIEHDENTSIKWVGDDCNTDGIFTPQANTEYELSFKVIKITSGMFAPPYYIIARVGAC